MESPGESPSPESARHLLAALAAGGPALVALSGGVDSALVASLATEALGERAIAVTLSGPAVTAAEVARARAVARAIGIRHEVRPVDPLRLPEYRANPTNRCFFCRTAESEVLREVGGALGIAQYLDGIQVDDLGDDRPGIAAMERAGFVHPLARAGWGKREVRALARARGLPNWDAPSDACLASRVRHGQPIDRELLARVERAEDRVRSEGFRQVRVRVAGRAARIEVEPGEVARLTRAAEAGSLLADLRSLGFAEVTIDPRGYGASRAAPAHP